MSGNIPSNNVTVAVTDCSGGTDAAIFSGPTLNYLLQGTLSLSFGAGGNITPNNQAFDSGGPCSMPNTGFVGYTALNQSTVTIPIGNLTATGDTNNNSSSIILTGGVVVNATLLNYGIDENLIAVLYDVSPTGKYQEITSGPYKINAATTGSVSFELFPDGWVLQPGHKLAVVLTNRSNQFSSDQVPTDIINSLRSVSCVSISFCMAVDNAGESYSYNGSAWSINPTGDTNPLTSVSCVSISFCISADLTGNMLYYNGTSFSSVARVSNYTIKSVSCVSISFCMAVDNNGNAYVCSGTGCDSSPPVFTKTSATGVTDPINSVSCLSADFCSAVDNYGNALSYNGSIWNSPISIDPSNSLSSISCVSSITTECIATDYAGNIIIGTYSSSVLRFASPELTDKSLNNIGNFITSVSCLTGFCMAVDASGNFLWTSTYLNWIPPAQIIGNQTNFTSISCFSYNSYSDCIGVNLKGQADFYSGESGIWIPQNITSNSLESVGCTTDTSVLCVAGDNNGNVYTMTLVSGQPTWSAAMSIDGSNSITSISCSSTNLCVAVDNSGNVYYSTAPATWGTSNYFQIDTNKSLTSVSCPTDTFCAAVDNSGNEFYSITPTIKGTWSSTNNNIDSSNQLNSISCTINTTKYVCTTVDNAGNVLSNPDSSSSTSSWSILKGVYPNPDLTSISCAPGLSPTNVISQCEVTDNNSNVFNLLYTTSPAPYKSSWSSPSYQGALDQNINNSSSPFPQISCFNTAYPASGSLPDNFSCFEVDNAGNGFVYNGSSWSNTSGLYVSNITLTIPEL